jgi:L-alanine-DL-glutamate epimerase-like enolase superfamily enzyme
VVGESFHALRIGEADGQLSGTSAMFDSLMEVPDRLGCASASGMTGGNLPCYERAAHRLRGPTECEAAMKINAVDVTLFAWDDIPPTRYALGAQNTSGKSNLGLVRISTDAGLEGHAFLGSAMNPAETDAGALIRFLAPILIGRDPRAREDLHAEMRMRQRVAGLRTIGACDTALWDIAAKAAGMPLYKLFGSDRSAIPAYASSQILGSREEYAGEAAQFKSHGWQAYKVHPPQNPADDIRVCESVRRAVGDDYPLMLDATWSYSYDEALKVGRAIERLGFLWFEDPLNEEDIYSYVKLKQKLDIPIMATEYPSGDIGTYAVWLTERATDYLRGDIPLKGGITTMLKTAHLAEAFHMNFEVHHGGNSLNNMAQLHFACALPNTTYFEVLLPHGAHKYGVLNDIQIGRDGLAHCPQVPGIGASIDFDLIKRKQIAQLG